MHILYITSYTCIGFPTVLRGGGRAPGQLPLRENGILALKVAFASARLLAPMRRHLTPAACSAIRDTSMSGLPLTSVKAPTTRPWTTGRLGLSRRSVCFQYVDRKYLEPPPTITPSRALQKSRKIGRSGLCCRNSTSAWPSNRWLAVYAGSGRNPPFVGVDARGPLLLPALPPRLSS
jgi:hypothetical protein